MKKRASRQADKPVGEGLRPDSAVVRLTFSDGLRYALAAFSPLFEADPAALVQIIALIEGAEKRSLVPRRVLVAGRYVLWFEEFTRVVERFRRLGKPAVTYTPRSVGRPRADDVEIVD